MKSKCSTHRSPGSRYTGVEFGPRESTCSEAGDVGEGDDEGCCGIDCYEANYVAVA